jgi:hypothetical protein
LPYPVNARNFLAIKKINLNHMAKTAAKSTTKAPAKKTSAKTTTVSETNPIVKTSEAALKKLKDLGIDQQLQADLEWCLGSYKADKNPVGLYEVARRTLSVFKENKNTKGVTAKLISDLEKIAQ